MGLIRLTVVVARVEVNTLFHVVDSPDPFTAILGRPWLDSIGVVSSPLHRCLSFYEKAGKYILVYADPVGTAESNVAAMQIRKELAGNKKRRAIEAMATEKS